MATYAAGVSPISVALIGCGAVSEAYYAPAVEELHKEGLVRLTALYDPVPERVGAIKALFPSAVVMRDIDECAALGAELAIVASPNRYHAEHTVRLLSLGIAVLCEKPMATSVADAETMVAAAAAAGRPLAVGLFRRFFPAMQAVRFMVAERTLGTAIDFDFSEGGRFAWASASAALFRRADTGGGVLIDLGSHLIDLLVWWFGEPLGVDYEDDAMGGVEANCTLTLSFSDGTNGRLCLSRDHALPNRCVIHCQRGWIGWNVWDKTRADELQFGAPGLDFEIDGLLHQLQTTRSLLPARNMEQCFVAQIRNVARAARGLEAVAVPGDAAIASLRVIERAYQRARPLSMPWLSTRERQEVDSLRSLREEGRAWRP